jgi:hypothetical protein
MFSVFLWKLSLTSYCARYSQSLYSYVDTVQSIVGIHKQFCNAAEILGFRNTGILAGFERFHEQSLVTGWNPRIGKAGHYWSAKGGGSDSKTMSVHGFQQDYFASFN